jgi:spermidine synthase
LVVSFAAGFLSLSIEILWVRLLSYITGGRANVFGNLLGFYLVGIALGALAAKRRCEGGRESLPTSMAGFLLGAAGLLFFVVPVGAQIMSWIGVAALPIFYFGAAGVALLTGAVFPMLTHYAVTRSKAVGVPVSGVYFANILGATAGPLLTGFYLLQWFSIEENILGFSLLTLALGLVLALAGHRAAPLPRRWIAAVALTGVVGLAGYPLAYGDLLEKLFFKQHYAENDPFALTVQSRSGIVNVFTLKDGRHNVAGGGVYDGGFNTSLERNMNKIDHAYLIPALHQRPARIMVVGLSSGSWVRVLLNHTAVEEIVVVEINPGYVELVEWNPENSTIFDEPRMKLVIDDARRWLLRNPEERFDFIVMNTTFYWRANINDLLSREFLMLVDDHLNPGGVFYYNTTGSRDAYYTVSRVFSHVVQYRSFVAGSDSPFSNRSDEKLDRLAGFSYQGEPILEWKDGRLRPLLEKLARAETENQKAKLEELGSMAYLITDDNLASEFKSGRKLYAPPRKWLRLFELWGK